MPCHTGGDIVYAVRTPSAVRLLIGDVMGHGAKAAATAATVTRAFARLAARGDPPDAIMMRLDQLVASRAGEEFVTAQVISVPQDRRAEPEIVCCGHPPPMLLGEGRASFLDVVAPAPPLGLLGMTAQKARADLLGAGPGDSLLLYTDGVTDACDSRGRPYPLAERATALGDAARSGGAPVLPALLASLMRHTGGVLRDDATLLHLAFGGA